VRLQYILDTGRSLTIDVLDAAKAAIPSTPFVFMVPASNQHERRHVEQVIPSFLGSPCLEICCVGRESESLHDALDHMIEDRGLLDIVTTWEVDEREACDYFLNSASGGTGSLLALVLEHDGLTDELKRRSNRGP
jgi:hypothetical protein